MITSVEGTGKTIEKAVENALLELKVPREDVDIKILSEGGIFKKAKVVVSISEDALAKYQKHKKFVEEEKELEEKSEAKAESEEKEEKKERKRSKKSRKKGWERRKESWKRAWKRREKRKENWRKIRKILWPRRIFKRPFQSSW